MRQKFIYGDCVKIKADLGPHKKYHTKDCEAIVIGSYGDIYGKNMSGELDKKSYKLYITEKRYTSAWYDENDLIDLELNLSELLRSL